MDATFFRKYADIIQAAHTSPLQEADDAPVSQAELTNLYKQGKPVHFVKNTPVALVPFQQLEKLVGDQAADKIKQLAGAVDKTSYDQAYKDNGYVVFQWNSKDNSPDIYIANPNVVKSKYVKFMGQLPSDAKSRSKIPSLVVMQHLKVDPSRMPFYVKVVPVEMVHVDDLGLANKTIQTNWGEQTVQAGGYLVREENGHIYTVAPDAQGLPIGYVKAGINESTTGTGNPFDLPARDPFWLYMVADVRQTKEGAFTMDIIFREGFNSNPYKMGEVVYTSNASQPSLSGKLSRWVNRQKQEHDIHITDPNHPLMKIVQKAVESYMDSKAASKNSLSSISNKPNNPNYDPNDFSNRK
jgi:hypothetical protein